MQPNDSPAPKSMPLDDLHRIEDLAAAYPQVLSLRALRLQVKKRFENGLAGAVVPVGKRLLISKTGYEAWLGSRAGGTRGEANHG